MTTNRAFVVVGGRVYKHALQAVRPVVLEEAQPLLEQLHAKALEAKKVLWTKFHSDPAVYLDVLEQLLNGAEEMKESPDPNMWNKWVSVLNKVGQSMVDNANMTKDLLGDTHKTISNIKAIQHKAKGLGKQSPDPSGYNALVEALESFLVDMRTPG